MGSTSLYFASCVIVSTWAIFQTFNLEVNHEDFPISQRLRVDADSAKFFKFLTQQHVLEKLLPWLTRFKEADARILSTGKFYRAFLNLPILGIGRIHLSVWDYRPFDFLVLESNDTVTGQRIEIRSERYHDLTILRTMVYLRKSSAVYHYTVGFALRRHIARQLEKSLPAVAEIYRAVEERRKDIYFKN